VKMDSNDRKDGIAPEEQNVNAQKRKVCIELCRTDMLNGKSGKDV